MSPATSLTKQLFKNDSNFLLQLEPPQRLVSDLADALARHGELLVDFLEYVAEAHAQHSLAASR